MDWLYLASAIAAGFIVRDLARPYVAEINWRTTDWLQGLLARLFSK